MNTEDETNTKPGESTGKPAPAKAKEKPAPAKAKEKPAPAETRVPPCPPEDPRAGDKTPEVIAWWFQYHPEQAAKKYEGRKFARPE